MITHFRRTLASLLFVATVPAMAHAQPATYTSFDDFVAGVGSYGIDTYDDMTSYESIDGPLARQAGSYGYMASAAAAPLNTFFPIDGANASDVWLSVDDATVSITFNGFGSDVRAIGGYFFSTTFIGFVSGQPVTVEARDVMDVTRSFTFSPESFNEFWGVRFENSLASLTLVADNSAATGDDAFYATVNNLVLAEAPSAVPEPSSVLLLCAGAATLAFIRRRRVVR